MRNNPDIFALVVLALLFSTGADRVLAGLFASRVEKPRESRVVVIESPLIFK